MINQPLIATVICLSCVGVPARASAQTAELTARDIIRALQTPLDMKDFQNPMTLKEALGLLHEKIEELGVLGKNVGLPIFIDQGAFQDDHPEAPDIYESQVKFPPYPKKMTVASALQHALGQVPTGNATYVVRRGTITILTVKHASIKVLLQQKVLANFEKKPLDEVLHELAEQTGVSIQLDSRAKEKQPLQVTALFRNDTSLRDALIIMADMAGLQVVELPSAVYVTSSVNAEALRKTVSKK